MQYWELVIIESVYILKKYIYNVRNDNNSRDQVNNDTEKKDWEVSVCVSI